MRRQRKNSHTLQLDSWENKPLGEEFWILGVGQLLKFFESGEEDLGRILREIRVYFGDEARVGLF